MALLPACHRSSWIWWKWKVTSLAECVVQVLTTLGNAHSEMQVLDHPGPHPHTGVESSLPMLQPPNPSNAGTVAIITHSETAGKCQRRREPEYLMKNFQTALALRRFKIPKPIIQTLKQSASRNNNRNHKKTSKTRIPSNLPRNSPQPPYSRKDVKLHGPRLPKFTRQTWQGLEHIHL